MRQRIHNIVHLVDPRTTSGDSLLHLSVAKNNTLKTQNLFEDGQYSFFPSAEVSRLLVECGAKVNAANHNASTPLHVACQATNYRQEVSLRRFAVALNVVAASAVSVDPALTSYYCF
jgi:ankyrin repeat protein